MRAVIQRVKSASVTVDGNIVSKIGPGICVLIGISKDDTETDSNYICNKILNLKLFDNLETGKRWSKNVMDRNFEILCVSQFTLYSVLKGNKLDFHLAMDGDQSKLMYDNLLEKLRNAYIPTNIKSGIFGAMMDVNIINEGPVTINLDSVKEKCSQ